MDMHFSAHIFNSDVRNMLQVTIYVLGTYQSVREYKFDCECVSNRKRESRGEQEKEIEKWKN